MSKINKILENVFKQYGFAKRSKESDGYRSLLVNFKHVEGRFREYAQEAVANEAQDVLVKLQKGTPLSDDDRNLIRFFIIGDAEYYTKIENNFGDWMKELERIVSVLRQYENKQFSLKNISIVRAVCRDAMNLLPSIIFYLEELNRVEKFTKLISGDLDRQSRIMLSSIIKTALESDRV